MQFFEDSRGCLRPTSDIKVIYEATKEVYHHGFRQDVHDVLLTDGKTCEMDEWQRERLERTPVAILPAAPETYLLTLPQEIDDAVEHLWKTPILAWAVTGAGLPEPITADGRNDGLSEGRPILFPNGIVTHQHNQSWRSEAHWIQDVLRDRKERKAAA